MKLVAALVLAITSASSQAKGTLFDVKSSKEGLNVPITLCLSGVAQMSCQLYTVEGHDIFVKTKTTNTKVFPEAGIKVGTTGYKLSGCVAHANGYCIFAANSYTNVHLSLK